MSDPIKEAAVRPVIEDVLKELVNREITMKQAREALVRVLSGEYNK